MKLYMSIINENLVPDPTAKAAAARRKLAKAAGHTVTKGKTLEIDRYFIKPTNPESPVVPVLANTKGEVREALVTFKRNGVAATVVDRRHPEGGMYV
jgi:hypothetical protein